VGGSTWREKLGEIAPKYHIRKPEIDILLLMNMCNKKRR